MYKTENLRKDATCCASDVLCKIDIAAQHTRSFSRFTKVVMDAFVTDMEKAMKKAYFKGLRDAVLIYTEKEDLQYIKDAIHKASGELNNTNV